jgi:predicted regulator of Ras-like GTPase activity (Roadblock/LC7/MglB family)
MSGFLRKVFGKASQAAPESPAAPAPTAPVWTPPTPAAPPAPPAYRNGGGPVNGNGHGPSAGGKGVDIPLQSILSGLPQELQPRLKHSYVGPLTVAIPLEKILSQLSRGAVKITFGELRQAAPALFTEDNDRDKALVTLPLAEILPRLNPALITRRREQKQIEIPAEISSPFDSRGRGLAFTTAPSRTEGSPVGPAGRHITPAPSAPPPSPAPAYHSPASVTPVTPIAPAVPMPPTAPPSRNGISFAPTPPPPSAAPVTPPSFASSPARPAREAAPPHPGLAPQAPIPMPSAYVPPAAPDFVPAAALAPAPAPAAFAPETPLVVGLSSLVEAWPDTVRKEISSLNLAEAHVALPSDLVDQSLRKGRIAFSWKQLRSWMQPAPVATVSTQDNTILELPLKVVAPLFLARQQEAGKAKKRIVVDQNIPNLFFGFPQPETGASKPALPKPGAGKSQDTNYFSREEEKPVPAADGKSPPSPGTKFVAKYATPNEVVSRAAAFEGVAGALIALPDGLMVASRLSTDLNADTLAAFLPQIFSKVNQCTKELRMGELNNLNFTVGNVPWKIFRVNAIFFAAFGRAGEPLPTAQLAALAAELDHKPK